MIDPRADGLPQPLVVRLETAPAEQAAPVPSTGEVTKYLRETAKWIVGGVIGTAGAVLAGSSLTNLGALDPAEDGRRLALAVGGALVGFAAIGRLMSRALDVLYVPSVSLSRLLAAPAPSEWGRLRSVVESEFGLQKKGRGSLKVLLETPDDDPVPTIAAMLPYFYVRLKFAALIRSLPWTVLGAMIGFGLFAWAANPPEKPKPAGTPSAAAGE